MGTSNSKGLRGNSQTKEKHDEWSQEWHAHKPSEAVSWNEGETNSVGIRPNDIHCTATLLSHYQDFVVYLGFSFWRKLLLHSSTYSHNRTRPADILHRKKLSEPWELSAVGDLKGFTRQFFPNRLPRPLVPAAVSEEAQEHFSYFLRGLLRSEQRDCVAALVLHTHIDLTPGAWNGRNYGSPGANTFNFLNIAAAANDVRMVTFLCAQPGVEVDARGSWSATPLIDAAYQGSKESSELLIQLGADVNACGGIDSDSNALLNACQTSPSLALHLIAKGANVNVADGRQRTPLYHACDVEIPGPPREFSLELIRVLIEHGADVNAKDMSNITALHKADRYEVVKLLVDAGAVMISKIEYGATSTPLIQAVKIGDVRSVKLLVEKGATHEINDYAENSTTLLHYAGSGEVVDFLLDPVNNRPEWKITSVDVLDEPRYTPLISVMGHRRQEPQVLSAVKALLRHGADPTYVKKKTYATHRTSVLEMAEYENRTPQVAQVIREAIAKKKGKPIPETTSSTTDGADANKVGNKKENKKKNKEDDCVVQ